jgi:organic hydroperoxide reductase OsmC/OhrA
MSRTATYHTTVNWKGEHWGHIVMGNGPEMDFSAPPDAEGHGGVFTPEDAFVAAANTCIMMMFIWANLTERRPSPTYACGLLSESQQARKIRQWLRHAHAAPCNRLRSTASWLTRLNPRSSLSQLSK